MIDERPQASDFSLYPMRNYGSTIWTNAVFYQIGSSTAHPIRSAPEDGIIMQTGSTVQSVPSGSGYPSDAFEDDWVHC